jgi:hypothetical protein
MTPAYELPAAAATAQVFYDFTSGVYSVTGLLGAYDVGQKYVDPLPAAQWTAEALAGAGVR